MKKIGIIGAGNMGEAIIKGLTLKPCLFNCDHVIVSDASGDRLGYIKKTYKVKTVAYNEELVRIVDILILAVKPQILGNVLLEVGKFIDDKKIVISIAAGIKTECIEKRLLGHAAVIRAMPNMPAMAQCGISAVCFGKFVKPKHKKTALEILSKIGEIVEVKENQMDIVTAVSGSGPAYFFFVIEKLIQTAVKEGLSEESARKLAVYTAYGASRLILETKQSPRILRQKVTSKGGTTEAAFGVLESEGFGELLVKAVKAAIKRSKELSCS